jgi:hypothetical protein
MTQTLYAHINKIKNNKIIKIKKTVGELTMYEGGTYMKATAQLGGMKRTHLKLNPSILSVVNWY